MSATASLRQTLVQSAATPLTRRVPSRNGTRCVTCRVLLEQPRGNGRSTAGARLEFGAPPLHATPPLKSNGNPLSICPGRGEGAIALLLKTPLERVTRNATNREPGAPAPFRAHLVGDGARARRVVRLDHRLGDADAHAGEDARPAPIIRPATERPGIRLHGRAPARPERAPPSYGRSDPGHTLPGA